MSKHTIMIKRTLFHELTGEDPRNEAVLPKLLAPDSVNYFFIEDGYVMEYYPVEGGKIIAMFFGPMELVLPSHLAYSRYHFFDGTIAGSMMHGDVFRCLRRYPIFAAIYQEAELDYRKRVAERLYVAENLTDLERFAHLKATQPWVLEVAAEEDVANYLDVSVAVLRKLRRDEGRRRFVIPYL
jgi:hypothetical protein